MNSRYAIDFLIFYQGSKISKRFHTQVSALSSSSDIFSGIAVLIITHHLLHFSSFFPLAEQLSIIGITFTVITIKSCTELVVSIKLINIEVDNMCYRLRVCVVGSD